MRALAAEEQLGRLNPVLVYSTHAPQQTAGNTIPSSNVAADDQQTNVASPPRGTFGPSSIRPIPDIQRKYSSPMESTLFRHKRGRLVVRQRAHSVSSCEATIVEVLRPVMRSESGESSPSTTVATSPGSPYLRSGTLSVSTRNCSSKERPAGAMRSRQARTSPIPAIWAPATSSRSSQPKIARPGPSMSCFAKGAVVCVARGTVSL